MSLENLRKMARLSIPELKINKMDSTDLDLILKAGVKLIAQSLKCLNKTTNFNVVADTSEYTISSILPDYASIGESGIYWNAGTESAPQWTQLEPKTKEWLNDKYTNWRDADSGSPLYYFIETNTITFYPTPSASLANGFKINYFRFPTEMTQNEDYAFENIPHLEILDECIIAYAKWKISPIVNNKNEENIYEVAFYNDLSRKSSLLDNRPDISSFNSYDRNHVKFRGKV